MAALTLSGGGARPAAFGLGVLRELKDTEFVWEGERTSLLDQISLVNGVSGGSILAAHYAIDPAAKTGNQSHGTGADVGLELPGGAQGA